MAFFGDVIRLSGTQGTYLLNQIECMIQGLFYAAVL